MSYEKINVKINDRESVSIPVEQLLPADGETEIGTLETGRKFQVIILQDQLEYVLGEYANHKVLIPYDPNK